MRRPGYHRDRGGMEVNMTPMIDVIFNLLIFFVCTVSFQPPELLLPTTLSMAGSGAAPVPLPPEIQEFEEIVIKVLAVDGQIHWQINDRPYASLADVRGVLLAIVELQANLPVIIDAGAEVPLGSVIDLYDVCRLVGFDKVQFAASVGP
jgi:biopolymer transport protein ExbD